MTHWYKKFSVFVVAAITYLVGQYFRGSWLADQNIRTFCHSYTENGKLYCNSPYLDTLGWPLITLGEFLAVIGIVLLFANERALHRWFKFSLFYVPIATILVLWIYPLTAPLGAIAGYDVGVNNAGWLYLFATLYIVLREFFRKRK